MLAGKPNGMNRALSAPAVPMVADPEFPTAFSGLVHAPAGSNAVGGIPPFIAFTALPCIGPVTRTSCMPVSGSMYLVACPVSVVMPPALVMDRSMLGNAALYGAAESNGSVSPAMSPNGGLRVVKDGGDLTSLPHVT